ncbi:MAG: tyrosine-type recombinase/integrase [Pseudonocardiaceae bacterium]
MDTAHHKGAAYLFESSWKKPYSTRGVRAMLARYADKAGLPHTMPPHRLRHFLFTWLKTHGIDDALIHPYSGHTTRAATAPPASPWLSRGHCTSRRTSQRVRHKRRAHRADFEQSSNAKKRPSVNTRVTRAIEKRHRRCQREFRHDGASTRGSGRLPA